ncbi:MAG: YaeQ family protein [Sulfuritalea sp.]|nr:YaeQ family protein [Sulfuritalea sp.]
MALKSTIFKVELQIADLDRNYYQNHTLTVARHPSETDERMMVRVLAFAMHADPALVFGKGLSSEDEPDLWRKDLTGAIELWIDVGLPDEKRIRRACGRSQQVVVLTYGGRVADMWWQQNQAALQRQDKLTVINLSTEDSRALAALAERGMQLQCTLQEAELWLIVDGENTRIVPEIRMAPPRR